VWCWVLIQGIKQTSVLFNHGPNKASLLPDSCRTTERSGNSISDDVTDDVIGND
jgi:hypothetical protein